MLSACKIKFYVVLSVNFPQLENEPYTDLYNYFYRDLASFRFGWIFYWHWSNAVVIVDFNLAGIFVVMSRIWIHKFLISFDQD